jgi:hypothetical protein
MERFEIKHLVLQHGPPSRPRLTGMLNLIFLLLQAVPAQRPIEEAVAAFAKGETAARDEILKAGTAAILPLRRIRKEPAEAIDALLFDLKKAAAGFSTKAILDALDRKRTIDTGRVDLWTAVAEASDGLNLVFDPILFRSHVDKQMTLDFKDRPRREILESFCRQAELDYGFFYDVILIATPERLWPAGSTRRIAPLTGPEQERAARLVERLSSDRVEERDGASAALRALGTGVLPLLEKGARGPDGEGRARCADLIRQLTAPPPPPVFRAPAAARQKLEGADDELLKRLREELISFKVQDIVLAGAFQLMCQPRQLPVQLGAALKDARVTLDVQNVSSWTLLCVATHAYGFDFLIRDGRLVIDAKDEIERLIRR